VAIGLAIAPRLVLAQADGNLVLDESLASATAGTRSGGTFVGDGWRVDSRFDSILWHLPTLRHGALEFSVRGLAPAGPWEGCPSPAEEGMEDKAELFHMYDWQAGDSDGSYTDGTCGGYRNTPFKHFVRKAGCIEADPSRRKEDSLELLWQLSCYAIQPNIIEPDTARLSWDPGTTYTFREEWGPDGAGNSVLDLWRDGEHLSTLSLPGDWAPAGHAIRIGASPRAFTVTDMGAPTGAIYSNIKVWDLGDAGPVEPVDPGQVRRGLVRVVGNALVDDDGAFLGLGFSYMRALHHAKHNRAQLRADLAFMKARGFQFFRALSMVGWYEAWDGLEIAPVSFTSRAGKHVDAWPDYWQHLRDLVDIAYDEYGLRTQITIFADAQLMPEKSARQQHMSTMLSSVVAGREHKLLLLEVANEAWQNGFDGSAGLADLKEFGRYLNSHTAVPVAITSNHGVNTLAEVYAGEPVDIATWHFSRNLDIEGGWYPVRDCWFADDLADVPPASSNEPIGPGASVASENDPIKLVTAAAVAFVAHLPIYVYHTGAGVFGRDSFAAMAGVGNFVHLAELLPADLANWQRNTGVEADSPFTLIGGALYLPGSTRGDEYVAVPYGIGPGGVTLQARRALAYRVYDPLTGALVAEGSLAAGAQGTLAQGPGAYLITNYSPRPPAAVVIAQPADGSAFSVGAAQSVSMSAADAIRVELFVDGVSVGEDTTPADGFAITWTPGAGNELRSLVATASFAAASPVSSAPVRVVDRASLRPAQPVATTLPGLDAEYYEGTWLLLPDFDALVAASTGVSDGFSLAARGRDDNFGFRFTGYVELPTDGLWTFATVSDDGSRLFIDGAEVLNNDGLHGMQSVSGEIKLAAGKHALSLAYFENAGGEGLEVFWALGNATLASIPTSALSRGGAPGDLLAPVLTITAPIPGSTVSGVVTIAGTATDDVLVSLVQVSVAGVQVGAATLSGTTWELAWDSRSVADAIHTVEVAAFDGSGKESTGSIVVRVANAGAVTGPSPDLTSELAAAGCACRSSSGSGMISLSVLGWLWHRRRRLRAQNQRS
jgi:MYXO-CTERM domain-containing protein